MSNLINPSTQKEKRNGLIVSMVLHTCIIILLMFPLLKIPIPPPGPEGIQVNLGIPDVGQGEENAPTAPAEEVTPPQPETPQRQEVKKQEVSTKQPPVKEKKVVETEDPEAVALREKARKEKMEQEEQTRQQNEAIKKQQEEKARKEAEAARLKNELGGLLGPGKGKGKGETGKPGNQGDPDGDPNSDILKGLSKGEGKIGGGLSGRGIRAQPSLSDNSQSEGTVVIEVCVDQSGSVTQARPTLKGSTITKKETIELARKNALQWKFEPGGVETQCGTITYRFKLQ